MKPKPSAAHSPSTSHDARIDATLRHYAQAVPFPGLESRVAARIAAASQLAQSQKSLPLLLLRRVLMGTLATAAACGIVVGTLRHTPQAALPRSAGRAQTGGASTAGAVHVPTRSVPSSAEINPRAPRTPHHSRAAISPNQVHHASGAGVPRSPYAPADQPGNPQQ